MLDAPMRLGLVAGEASGDLLASLLLKGLAQRWPNMRAFGIGGPRMVSGGFETWWPMERLSVFGYVDALGRLPELLRIRRQLGDRLLADPPRVFIAVDAPDFNFALEVRLRQAGVRTVHFVCPSIWAWRPERVQKLKGAADHVLCLFPFEPALLRSHGLDATYVGHPLADIIALEDGRTAARLALGLPLHAEIVAVLPGSRRSEIDQIGPRFAAAAGLMHRQRPDLHFVLPAAPGHGTVIRQHWLRWAPKVPVQVLEGQSHPALAACNVALVASGTATLEAALFKRPMVIAYHLSWLNWQRMKRMSLQPWFGLPNILAGEFVVPELIQQAATPTALAEATLEWLNQPARVASLRQRFTDLHHLLRQDTAQRAGDAIAQVIAQ